MNRSDLYYLPAEVDYRRERAARKARRGQWWPRNDSATSARTVPGRRNRVIT
jgi:hypothetical protein